MVGSMVAADTLFAYGVLDRSGVFDFACGPGDDDALVADLGSSFIKMGGQFGMVDLMYTYLTKIKSQEYRPGKNYVVARQWT